ncbi:hypothetical protein DFH07DRAFT_815202 [Mycena maculata]|uniref:Uncharacterized protein n=1 Tax=Mycena maculata TaxID=230809 RepID=A0AAD7JBQ3_9AGAR|nr:hypothetical protein DFH07DRAFT_815202 [Mycena maculata]
MFVPFLTRRLEKRRGKSGGDGGEGGGGKGGTSEGGSDTTSRTDPITTSGTSKSATSYGSGGGKPVTIPAGQLFAGRSAGGGIRAQVFGTRTFGSGYPGITGRGVAGRGFPFFFWPLGFGAGGIGTPTYLHSDTEYGSADNTSRPGGVMMTAAFQSNSTNASTFRILADNITVVDLIADITANCSTSLSSSSDTLPSPYNDTTTLPPQPEQVVEYYRASSIALSLDGYNNTAIFEAEGTPDVPLPTNIDTTLLDCLNQTIGLAAPLIDSAGSQWEALPNNITLLGLIWLIWLSTFL